MPKKMDLTGKRFGRLVVIRQEGMSPGKRKRSLWLCVCDCGQTKLSSIATLRSGDCLSCGCLVREQPHRTKHGRYLSLEYRSWAMMIQRCCNENTPGYAGYGAIGIRVCERWKTFENFYEDMGPRPRGTSLDRIDTYGNYEPKNCRWATPVQQARNSRRNIFIEHDGETACVSEWSRKLGIPSATIYGRLKRGWSPERALG